MIKMSKMTWCHCAGTAGTGDRNSVKVALEVQPEDAHRSSIYEHGNRKDPVANGRQSRVVDDQ